MGHYNLLVTIAVGLKINNERAVQFRKLANAIVKDYSKNHFFEFGLEQPERVIQVYLAFGGRCGITQYSFDNGSLGDKIKQI